jgi:uncharacterized protein YjdB
MMTDTASGGFWSSGNTAVATIIAGTGAMTGVSAGSATITYMLATGCSVTRMVTVDPAPATITGGTTICQGSTSTLANTTVGGFWSSSNASIASVSAVIPGLVTGVAAGTVNISYTLPTGCFTSMPVTVNAAPAVGIISGSASVCVGSFTHLDNPISGGTWSSGNTAVATLSGMPGNVLGVAAGTAAISYVVTNSCGVAYATRVVTVIALPDAGTITGATTVNTGSTITLSNAAGGGAWISSNTTIANVGSTGIVSGISGGVVTISYSSEVCYREPAFCFPYYRGDGSMPGIKCNPEPCNHWRYMEQQ